MEEDKWGESDKTKRICCFLTNGACSPLSWCKLDIRGRDTTTTTTPSFLYSWPKFTVHYLHSIYEDSSHWSYFFLCNHKELTFNFFLFFFLPKYYFFMLFIKQLISSFVFILFTHYQTIFKLMPTLAFNLCVANHLREKKLKSYSELKGYFEWHEKTTPQNIFYYFMDSLKGFLCHRAAIYSV